MQSREWCTSNSAANGSFTGLALMGVGNKVADCIALFSLDCPGSVPVDTHVFQIAQKLGYVKGLNKNSSLTEKLYIE